MSSQPELARKALRELVRHVLAAEGEALTGVTYGDLSQRIGRTRRRLGVGMGAVLGAMGHMLKSARQSSGSIPLIQSLVVLKNGPLAGLPDEGMDEFWADYSSLSVAEKRKRVRAEHAKVARYGRKWQKVLNALRPMSGTREASPQPGGGRRIRYWVMKGNPSRYDWEENLVLNRVEDWHADKVPEEMKSGDRVFFWESGSKKRIVALGVVEDPFVREDADGDVQFDVRYLTTRLRWMPGIAFLRNVAELGGASFLKSGVHGTVYSLTDAEAKALYEIVVSGNPQVDLWPRLPGPVSLADVEIAAAEGGPRLLVHIALERRSRRIIEEKKRAFQAKHGRLFCEACGVDSVQKYGEIADGMCDVHHRKRISKAARTVITKLSDLAVLCPTCHRIIHRFDPMISVEELARRLWEPAKGATAPGCDAAH